MPFIEITGADQHASVRERVAAGLTEALTRSWGIAPEIVTVYFQPVAPTHYAHAGSLAPPGESRHFLKVHAFAREIALKRDAARRMTDAFVAAVACSPKSVVIYFFDRERHDVAHAGELACD